ncbi:hypothetical protein [Sandarakinorhabdus sp. DWP1-3-1]|uniref:hypothetical protein n=1 Tax=Sandarakinorhabdus sp. DWP1-3-1 TaxID=2804627 RepID=UPI003CFA4F57
MLSIAGLLYIVRLIRAGLAFRPGASRRDFRSDYLPAGGSAMKAIATAQANLSLSIGDWFDPVRNTRAIASGRASR